MPAPPNPRLNTYTTHLFLNSNPEIPNLTTLQLHVAINQELITCMQHIICPSIIYYN
jgi:hypothetical protein